MQRIIKKYDELDIYLKENNINNLFVVTFNKNLEINKYLEKYQVTYFTNFNPNPTYESVKEGVKLFRESKADFIIAIGGGSAMDVSKCIKLFSSMDDNKNYLEQEFKENLVTLMAIPTTAGTGSEATRYAVIYYNGVKKSVTHESIIPSIVLFDSKFLETLPLYQKKATLLDALSHAMESMWSINRTEESLNYSKKAIKLIINNIDNYLNNDSRVYNNMLLAANLAGCAINITQTTAGHAMCYKLTSLYGISHGHAAALVNMVLIPYMIDNISKCTPVNGEEYLLNIFDMLRETLELKSINELKNYLVNLLDELDLLNVNVDVNNLDELVSSVNLERLKNNPIKLDNTDIKNLYLNMFNEIERRKNGSKEFSKNY